MSQNVWMDKGRLMQRHKAFSLFCFGFTKQNKLNALYLDDSSPILQHAYKTFPIILYDTIGMVTIKLGTNLIQQEVFWTLFLTSAKHSICFDLSEPAAKSNRAASTK